MASLDSAAPLIPFLEGHVVTTAKIAGWERLVDSDLLNAAEQAGLRSAPDRR